MKSATVNQPSPTPKKQSVDAPLPAPPGTSGPPEYSALDKVDEEKDELLDTHPADSRPQLEQQPASHLSPPPEGAPQPQSRSQTTSQDAPAAMHGQGFGGPGNGRSGISGIAGHNTGPMGNYNAYGMQMCYEGKHNFKTNYGIVGIIFAIVCFPCGLIGLCIDNEEVCRRCGVPKA